MSGYHGSNMPGSQQSFLTEKAICIVKQLNFYVVRNASHLPNYPLMLAQRSVPSSNTVYLPHSNSLLRKNI